MGVVGLHRLCVTTKGAVETCSLFWLRPFLRIALPQLDEQVHCGSACPLRTLVLLSLADMHDSATHSTSQPFQPSRNIRKRLSRNQPTLAFGSCQPRHAAMQRWGPFAIRTAQYAVDNRWPQVVAGEGFLLHIETHRNKEPSGCATHADTKTCTHASGRCAFASA